MKKTILIVVLTLCGRGSQCLYYYIGHARATYNVNYLYPRKSTPIYDVKNDSISVNDVVGKLESSNKNGKTL